MDAEGISAIIRETCVVIFMSDVTQILDAIDAGDSAAAEQLLPLVYDELRRLAAAKLAQEQPGQTLDATGLVHEAYVRLVGSSGERERSESAVAHALGSNRFLNQRHFFAAAAEAIRRILIERARQRSALKYGGGRQRVPLTDIAQFTHTPDGLLAVNEAFERFTAQDPQRAELVKLRFFGGLTMPEAAVALGISLATAERWWTYSKAWLYAELSDEK
jgi:RNA polymerase sigma factor (TIGR02999 family)